MSTKQNPSLPTLPVELIHHIFHYLDAKTIVRSCRGICKRLYTIVKTYDQFQLDFNSIWKSDFHFLCNFIQPEHVKSLILSDNDETPGQIAYFLSIFRIKHFIQLRSLTLLEIEECYLNIILKDIKMLALNSLSIHSQHDYSRNNVNLDDLLSAVSLSSLYKFDLNIPSFDASILLWSSACIMQHLEVVCRTFDEYFNILCCLPNLQTLVVEQFDDNNVSRAIPKLAQLNPSCQLSSLTLKYCNIDMIIIELLLSLTPSLKHLRLMRSVELQVFVSNLPRWEKFVQTKLPLLSKFEFFVIEAPTFYNTPVDTELIIAPFRTSFWTETKKWFAICDYIMSPRAVILYSPSIFDPQFEYVYESKQISRSTSAPSINNTIIMEGARKMRLDLVKAMSSTTSVQGGLPNSPVFPKLNELTLHINDEWPLGSFRFLSTLIDLSHLVKFSLVIGDPFNPYSELPASIDKLFELTTNIHSLNILLHSYSYGDDHNLKICCLVPAHVRHLKLPVSSVDQMRTIVHKLKSRSSIQFQYTNTYPSASEMMLEWFKHDTGYYTYRMNRSSLCMWFDKYVHTS